MFMSSQLAIGFAKMSQLLDYFKTQAKIHKALVDALADFEKFEALDSNVKELEVRKNMLQLELQARTEDLAALATQYAAEQEKLSGEIVKAKEEASKIVAQSQVTAKDILKHAESEANVLINEAKLDAWDWTDKADKAKAEAQKAKEEYATWNQKLLTVQAKLANLKEQL